MEEKSYGQILDERFVNEEDSGGGGGNSFGTAEIVITSTSPMEDPTVSITLDGLSTIEDYATLYLQGMTGILSEQVLISTYNSEAGPNDTLIGQHSIDVFDSTKFVESICYSTIKVTSGGYVVKSTSNFYRIFQSGIWGDWTIAYDE